MKKTLLAVAAIGAFASAAQAQSSVTVYGIMDASYTATENATTSTAGAKTTVKGRNTVNGDGALSTSRIGFRGVEDLGGGKKAEFMLEYDLVNIGNGGNGNDTAVSEAAPTTATVASGFGVRQSWVGISDATLGALRFGRQEESIHAVIAANSAGGANNIAGTIYSKGSAGPSPNDASVRPHDVYVNQAITYISPKVSGFQAQIQTSQNAYSATETTRLTGANETGGSITFDGVKNLQVAYGVAQLGFDTTTASTKTFRQSLGANYDFGVAQVFALAAQNKVDNKSGAVNLSDTKTYELGVKAPVTATIGVWASMFTGNRNSGTNGTTMANSQTAAASHADMGGFQLGTTYAFSKRTTAYAIYGQQNIKGKDAAATAKVESTGYALGLRHTF
jgi:predicted porin